VKDTTINGNG